MEFSARKDLTLRPGRTTVATAILDHGTADILEVEPKVFPVLPLQCSKLVAVWGTFDSCDGTPGFRVSAEDDMAVEIAPVNLKLHDVEGESAEGAMSCYLTRVEFTFEIQSDG